VEGPPLKRFCLRITPRIYEVVQRRRLATAGHNEPAGRLLTWSPEEPKRVGRPIIALKMILKGDTGLESSDSNERL